MKFGVVALCIAAVVLAVGECKKKAKVASSNESVWDDEKGYVPVDPATCEDCLPLLNKALTHAGKLAPTDVAYKPASSVLAAMRETLMGAEWFKMVYAGPIKKHMWYPTEICWIDFIHMIIRVEEHSYVVRSLGCFPDPAWV